MKPLFDAVMLNIAKALDLYRLGGVIGLLLGLSTSILISRTLRLRAADFAGRLRRRLHTQSADPLHAARVSST